MTDQEKLTLISEVSHIDKRYMHTKRSQTICYKYNFEEVATITKILTRGKETDRLIHISEAGEQLIKSYYNIELVKE